ncbi:MAG: L,D-transpeptidase [Solirubrobacterales bacterium]|nr:L,D-transpeptidase [Solirubrobacterales bacterium]
MNSPSLRIVTVAFATLLLGPANGVAQTPAAPQTAPPAGSAPPVNPQARLDPTKVVSASNPDPLELLQSAGDEIKLSDEKQITRWSHAQSTAKIHLTPQVSSRAVARLRFFTEDRLPEVYPVLAARQDSGGRAWLQIRVPKRPNGVTGWVLDETLSSFYIVRTSLVIDRSKLRATLFKRGRQIWSARVGIGKSATPTPAGQFWIRERLKGLGGGGTYGPWAFGTSAYSNLSDWPGGGVVGIHGTNQPGLIPGRPSHGCVRVRNDKIRALARLMPVGTPVSIIN